ncbi:hypothetical protein FDP41_002930 [Naegleria fowleri]|uniref:Ubiquilin n=1 Tax=Naegleria fowleri TaxID=5763 RepID=A0A6A5BVU4_NAEFO|nr:uncharacterized protein FDP41_002930 [Naegleria fowleri]KAF0978038.1 hypothetical protein FDP41_002930 [Naegleria fowleri]CAG4715738.1 unnamed protein product [Naegleria fowleri]
MKVTIRCSNGDTFSIDNVDLDNTVEEFKQVVASHSNIPASDQRLIYRGKVLKDQATLKSYGVEEGLTIHLVRGKPSGAATTTSSTTTPSATSTTTTPPPSTTTSSNVPPSSTTTSTTTTNNTTSQTAPNQQQNPFSLFGNLGGFGGDNNNNMFGAGGFPNVDPNMMQQMMNNPFVQSMLNNPDFIREMMNSNPQMQQIMRNNPEVGRMLQDPEMIRRAMEMARNPELMREMMRNTDLAMSNIENLPGGFDALRRMYSDIQEPLHEATTEMFRGTTTTPEQPTTSNTTSVPPGQPFNMWGNNSTGTAATTTTPPPSSNTSSTGNTGNTTNANPFANMFGGMGGMGFPNMGGMNPQQVQQMMNNPFMQRMMTEMLSDPQMLDQLINSNPMLQQMTQSNPMLRTMLSNPQFIQHVMQLQGMMNQSQGGTNTSSTTGGNAFPQMPNPFLFGNPWMGGQMPTTTANTQPPRERFAAQLSQLQEMGFFDEQSNIEALLATNGNVNAAVEYLLSNPPPSRNM